MTSSTGPKLPAPLLMQLLTKIYVPSRHRKQTYIQPSIFHILDCVILMLHQLNFNSKKSQSYPCSLLPRIAITVKKGHGFFNDTISNSPCASLRITRTTIWKKDSSLHLNSSIYSHTFLLTCHLQNYQIFLEPHSLTYETKWQNYHLPQFSFYPY